MERQAAVRALKSMATAPKSARKERVHAVKIRRTVRLLPMKPNGDEILQTSQSASGSSIVLSLNLFLLFGRVLLILEMVPLSEADDNVPEAKQSLFMCPSVDMRSC